MSTVIERDYGYRDQNYVMPFWGNWGANCNNHEGRWSGLIIGFVIFFLVLAFFVWQGNGMNQNHNHSCGKQDYIERGVAELKHTMTAQNGVATAQLETAIRALMKNNDDNTAKIIDSQKDMYIKQLEQKNMEMFVAKQNDDTRYLVQKNADQTNFMGQFAFNRLGEQIRQIDCQMLKTPQFIPFGGLATIGCNNGVRRCDDCCGNNA